MTRCSLSIAENCITKRQREKKKKEKEKEKEKEREKHNLMFTLMKWFSNVISHPTDSSVVWNSSIHSSILLGINKELTSSKRNK